MHLHLLPTPLLLSLLFLSTPHISYSQFTLDLNAPFEFDPQTPTSAVRPVTFTLPTSSSPLTISVAFCSTPSGDGDDGGSGTSAAGTATRPRIFASNSSAVMSPRADDVNGVDVKELTVARNGTGWVRFDQASEGGVVVVDLGSTTSGTPEMGFEIGVSDGDPLHTPLPLPFFGDSTSNQVLLFSPPLPLPPPNPPLPPPTYPNYTLPSANLSFPDAPSSDLLEALNATLVVAQTSALPEFDVNVDKEGGGKGAFVSGFPVSACAVRRLQGARVVGSQGAGVGAGTAEARLVARDEGAWRMQWLVEGLDPQVNYTAFVVLEGTKVAGPIQFVTKSATFGCSLLHSLPFCPRTAYTIPLTPPATGSFDSTNLDPTITAPLLQYMTNFTTSLLTFACGRDWYSPVQSCESCQRAYRDWLCAISFPRCAESTTSSGTDSAVQNPIAPALSNQTPQTPLSQDQLMRNPSPSLSTITSFFNTNNSTGTPWTALLPCLETCHAADRACPDFLGFRCPLPRFTASKSYGIGYVDGDGSGEVGESVGKKRGTDGRGSGEWLKDGGAVDGAQDRWGNVWCNAS